MRRKDTSSKIVYDFSREKEEDIETARKEYERKPEFDEKRRRWSVVDGLGLALKLRKNERAYNFIKNQNK